MSPLELALAGVIILCISFFWSIFRDTRRELWPRTIIAPIEIPIRRAINKRKKPWEDKQLLEKLKKHNLVTSVEVDNLARIIITTKPLYVKVNGQNRVIGKYQIGVDFSRTYRGIRILNISQRYETYDSPVINETKPCWGNFREEVERLIVSKDLEGILDFCLYFIVNPLGHNGYVESWEEWLQYAHPTPRWFNFEKYDNGMRQIRPEPLPLTPAQQTLSQNELTALRNLYIDLQRDLVELTKNGAPPAVVENILAKLREIDNQIRGFT